MRSNHYITPLINIVEPEQHITLVKKVYNFDVTIFVKHYISSEFYIQWIYFIHFIGKWAAVEYETGHELMTSRKN